MFKNFALHFYSMLSSRLSITRGHVVETIRRRGIDGDEYSYPVVRFECLEGRQHQFQSRTGYVAAEMPAPGSFVSVYFPHNRPERASLEPFSLMYLVRDLLIFGCSLVILALILAMSVHP